MKAVELIGVSVRRKRVPALGGVSLAVAAGERVALFGGSGAGKTTLLEVAAGITSADAGAARVLDRSARQASPRRAYVPSQPRGMGALTPLQAVRQAADRADLPKEDRRAAEVLDLLQLAPVADRPCDELSRGERMSVALASALAARPAALLLDNVTAGLPVPLQNALWSYIDHRRAHDGLAVLHATTSSAEAEGADRVALMAAGGIVKVGVPRELLAEWSDDVVTVEAADPETARRTVGRALDVEVAETEQGVRFRSVDGTAAAARLLRQASGGARVIYVRRPTLWDVLARLAEPDG